MNEYETDDDRRRRLDRERQDRCRDRKKAALPRLRVVDGTGEELPVAAPDELRLVLVRAAALAEDLAKTIIEVDPERAGARIAAAEARAAAADAHAVEARADLRDALAAAEDAEARAGAALDDAVAAAERATVAEERLAALGATHDQTVAELADARERLEHVASRVVDLEDALETEQARAGAAERALGDAVRRFQVLADAFARFLAAGRGDGP